MIREWTPADSNEPFVMLRVKMTVQLIQFYLVLLLECRALKIGYSVAWISDSGFKKYQQRFQLNAQKITLTREFS